MSDTNRPPNDSQTASSHGGPETDTAEVPEGDPQDEDPTAHDVQWTAGLVGGLAGGIVMGLILQFAIGAMPLIGAIIGIQSAIGGWLVHLSVSLFYGLIFAWTVSFPFLRDEFVRTLGGSAAAGFVYGGLLIIISGGVILTLVAEALALTERPLPIPGTGEGIWLGIWGGIAHLLYGTVLGTVYALWRGSGAEWPSTTEH